MWKQKLGISVERSFGEPEEAIRLVADIGFEAVSPEWERGGETERWIKAAKDAGLEVQAVHAPFQRINALWIEEDERAEDVMAEQIECLRDCAAWGVPVVVIHAFIGFKDHTPTRIGVERFGVIVAEARKLGVRIALENTEGEEYLTALMQAFPEETVGFCWDSGHEMCYNYGRDMLALYGDRLYMTHLNDNLGIRDHAGEITWLDDLHLLPFDGIADWTYNAQRLNRAKKQDILNFELNIRSKPNRYENLAYEKMEIHEYLTECYKRACRVAAKVLRERA